MSMYLTAHRVVRPNVREQGVNAFAYVHNRVWLGEPPPDLAETPITLLRSDITVAPPRGNRVRSYLDIVTPDGATSKQIVDDLNQILPFADDLALPWLIDSGDSRFAFGVDRQLAPAWREELQTLLNAVLTVAPAT